MELEKITEVMDKFEKTFEDLDVHTGVMEGAMGAATATSTPASQVTSGAIGAVLLKVLLIARYIAGLKLFGFYVNL